MFVSRESHGAIQDYIFFNDKELPMGIKSERLVSQFHELSRNPKGNSAYKLFSTMREEKTFVTSGAVCSDVTPISKEILIRIQNQIHQKYPLLSRLKVKRFHNKGRVIIHASIGIRRIHTSGKVDIIFDKFSRQYFERLPTAFTLNCLSND